MNNKRTITIAVDAMGGDYAPTQIIKGVNLAVQLYDIKVLLVGIESKIIEEYKSLKVSIPTSVEIIHASEIIEMDESPTKAIKKKKDSSIVKALSLVHDKQADAFVSAGNTGACMTGSFFHWGRLKGIERPAIAALLPTTRHTPAVLIDAGANSDCEPQMLVQFAQMGSIFSEKVIGIKKPRVGILNIGGEASKGNSLALATHKMFQENNYGVNFVGNIEGREIFLGECDVIICDGFTGNVTLKVAEGVAKMLTGILKHELKQSLMNKAGALLAKSAFKRLKKRIDYEEYGGSLLLGVNGICVIAHGGSNDLAIKNAIRVGYESASQDVTSTIMGLCKNGQQPVESTK